jgi:hypothetical protein
MIKQRQIMIDVVKYKIFNKPYENPNLVIRFMVRDDKKNCRRCQNNFDPARFLTQHTN